MEYLVTLTPTIIAEVSSCSEGEMNSVFYENSQSSIHNSGYTCPEVGAIQETVEPKAGNNPKVGVIQEKYVLPVTRQEKQRNLAYTI